MSETQEASLQHLQSLIKRCEAGEVNALWSFMKASVRLRHKKFHFPKGPICRPFEDGKRISSYGASSYRG